MNNSRAIIVQLLDPSPEHYSGSLPDLCHLLAQAIEHGDHNKAADDAIDWARRVLALAEYHLKRAREETAAEGQHPTVPCPPPTVPPALSCPHCGNQLITASFCGHCKSSPDEEKAPDTTRGCDYWPRAVG